MSEGYIKLFRKITESVVYQDSKTFHLWCHCLLKANHKTKQFLFNGEQITIKRGQFITGRNELAKELKMKSSSVYRRLRILEKLQKVNIKANNKFSIITVIKYNTYQSLETKSEQHTEQQVNNKRTTSEQQVNTNNNDNNDKNEKNRAGTQSNNLFSMDQCISIAEYNGYKSDEGERFFHFYNSQGWVRGKSQSPITDLNSAFRAWIDKGKAAGLLQPGSKETFEEMAARVARETGKA